MSRETEFSEHAKNMLIERKIPDEWVWRAISSPDNEETGVDGNTHYIKAIEEHGYRVLRVVVNSDVKPNRVITVFFDRRLKRKK